MKNGVPVRRLRLGECLREVNQGVGSSWKQYRLVGATRAGLAAAKEGVGKSPERYKLLEPGTIFYNPMRILLGSIAFLDEGQEPGITSPDYVVFKTRSGLIHPRWFYYWLRSDDGATFVRSLARGAVRERMLFKRLAAVEIELPPYESQLKFARAMEPLDRARAAAEAQFEAARILPAAYFRTVFEGDASRRWETRALSKISEIAGGIQKSPDRAPARFHRPYLTVRNVQRGFLDLSHVEQFEVTADELARLRLLPGDILIVEGNGSLDHIGPNALFGGDRDEWIHQNHVIRVRLDQALARPEFVSSYLNSNSGRRQMVEKAKTTSGLYTLSAGEVGALEVPMPSLQEQDWIVSNLAEQVGKAEQRRLVTERELETFGSLLAVLLRRAFSGEL